MNKLNKYHCWDQPKYQRKNSAPRPQALSNHNQDQGQLPIGSKCESASPPLLLRLFPPKGQRRLYFLPEDLAHGKEELCQDSQSACKEDTQGPLCSPRFPHPQEMLPLISSLPKADLGLLVGGSWEGDIQWEVTSCWILWLHSQVNRFGPGNWLQTDLLVLIIVWVTAMNWKMPSSSYCSEMWTLVSAHILLLGI